MNVVKIFCRETLECQFFLHKKARRIRKDNKRGMGGGGEEGERRNRDRRQAGTETDTVRDRQKHRCLKKWIKEKTQISEKESNLQ